MMLAAFLWLNRQDIEARERQLLTHEANILQSVLAVQLTAVSRALDSVTHDLDRWRNDPNQLARASHRLHAFAGAVVGVRSMVLLNADGTVIASNHDAMVGTDLSKRAYYQSARQAGAAETLIVSAPYRTHDGRWVIALARGVRGADGGFDGVVAATLDADTFLTLLQSVHHSAGMVVSLVHGDGLRFVAVLSQTGTQDEYGVNVAQPGSLFTRHRQSGQGASLLHGVRLAGGAPILMALRTVQQPELQMDKPLVVAVGRDAYMIFGDWRTNAGIVVGFYLLVGLMAAAGLRFLQRRQRQIWQKEAELSQQAAVVAARWRAVLEATNQGVWDWDARTDKVYFSPVWKSMLGYAEDEIGDDLSEWESRLHADDRDRVLADVQRHLDGEVPLYESVHRVYCKGEGSKWILDRGCVIERDGEGKPLRFVGTYTDVTQSRQQRERLDRLAESVPGALYQYQLEADGSSHFPYASPGIWNIYGYHPEVLQADASPVFERIHPEDAARVGESIELSARALTLWQIEYRVVLPEIGERWVRGMAQPQLTEAGAVLWHGYIHDVTEAKQQAMQLQETQRLLQHVMDEMPIGLCMVDASGTMYYRNRRFEELFGYAYSDVQTVGQWWLKAYPDPAVRHEAMSRWTRAVAHASQTGNDVPAEDYPVTTRDGTLRTVGIGGIRFGSRFLTTFVDHTEQHAQRELLHKLAFMDGLTGVHNRRHFDQALQLEWQRCRRDRQPLALILVDIDHFKRYNDTYGHQQGDVCLQAVASVLRAGFNRSHDLVARYGGEEFVCLMPGCDLAAARRKAQALCQAVYGMGVAHSSSRTAGVVTISLGVACLLPAEDNAPQDLLAQADANLYRAKAGGRNRAEDGTGQAAASPTA